MRYWHRADSRHCVCFGIFLGAVYIPTEHSLHPRLTTLGVRSPEIGRGQPTGSPAFAELAGDPRLGFERSTRALVYSACVSEFSLNDRFFGVLVIVALLSRVR